MTTKIKPIGAIIDSYDPFLNDLQGGRREGLYFTGERGKGSIESSIEEYDGRIVSYVYDQETIGYFENEIETLQDRIKELEEKIEDLESSLRHEQEKIKNANKQLDVAVSYMDSDELLDIVRFSQNILDGY